MRNYHTLFVFINEISNSYEKTRKYIRTYFKKTQSIGRQDVQKQLQILYSQLYEVLRSSCITIIILYLAYSDQSDLRIPAIYNGSDFPTAKRNRTNQSEPFT